MSMSAGNGTSIQSFGPSSYTYKVVSSVFMCILILFILVGNIFAIVAYSKTFRLRAATRFFIVNLAVTDLLVGTVVMPFWFHRMLLKEHYLRTTLYYAWVTVDISCSTASIASLAVLSVDRYVIITKPLLYEKLMPKSCAPVIIFLIWLYAIVLALLWQLEWKGYGLLATTCSFVLPVAIMIFSYANIFKVARFQAHRIRNSLPEENNSQSNKKPKRFKRELKAAKTISLVIGGFLVCWLPFFIVTVIGQYCKSNCNVTIELVIVVKWLHYANSAINPVIYAVHNRDFRDALRTLCTNRGRRELDATPDYQSMPVIATERNSGVSREGDRSTISITKV